LQIELARSSHSVGRNIWVFEWCTKYRYKMMGKLENRNIVAACVRQAAHRHSINIIEMAVMPDHIHMVASLPKRMDDIKAVKLLKGASSRKLFQVKEKVCLEVSKASFLEQGILLTHSRNNRLADASRLRQKPGSSSWGAVPELGSPRIYSGEDVTLPYGYRKAYIVPNVTIYMATKKLKKTDILETNEAYNKALIWFFSFPKRKIGLSDLSDELDISKTTAKRIVERLEKEGFLNKEVIGKAWRISCNIGYPYNITRKICYNLQMIYESGILNDIHEIIPNPISVTLFGSYRKGDDDDESDIDIAVEIIGNDDIKIYELGVLPQFGYRTNVVVNLHIFSRNKVDMNLFSNIANGIVLEGFLEVRP